MKLFRNIRSLFRKKSLEAEMAAEMREHLDRAVEANLAAGMSPSEAEYAARRQFGGIEQLKEQCRDERSRGWIWLEHFAQDLRYAVGSLRRSPVFTLTAVLTLVLGLGATTTIFTLVDAVVWQPLPYKEPQRLVEVGSWAFNRETLRIWTEAQSFLDHVEPYRTRVMVMSGEQEAAQLAFQAMTPGLVELLGRSPELGRWFGAAETEAGNQFVVVISHRFWQSRFGGDPNILGQKITLDDQAYTVIGVMPRDFSFRRPNTVGWMPLPRLTAETLNQRVDFVGRLRPDMEFAAANSGVKALNAQLDQSHPQPSKWGVGIVLMDNLRVNPGPRRMMVLTFGAVTFVLLIACANVANLLLVRATGRQREFSVRSALGAGRGRLVRQVLTESLVLVLAGTVGGLALAHWAVQAIWAVAPQDFTALTVNEVAIGWRVMVFATGLVSVAAIICGLMPALRASRSDSQQSVGGTSRSAMPTRHQRRWQQGFVVAQTALAFVLLVGAGLLLRGFLRLNAVSSGFEIKNLSALTLSLPSQRYGSAEQRKDFYERLRERVASLPGVTDTAIAGALPPSGSGIMFSIEVEVDGRAPQKMGASEILPYNTVSDDYFRVMKIPLVRGRSFSAEDISSGPPAIIINDRMAARLFGDSDPIGKRLRFHPRLPWLTVVGVAGDVRARGLSDESGDLEYYQALRQQGYSAYSTVVIRTAGDPRALDRAFRNEVSALDPRLPISSLSTAEALMQQTLSLPRFCLGLMTGFAGVALVLAAIGLYGVMSYSVTQRTQEIGVRIALGGAASDIVGLITRSGLALTGVGLVAGIGAALGLTRFLRTMLFEISALDPVTFAGVAVILAVIGAIACYLPARRAAKVDPMVALRSE